MVFLANWILSIEDHSKLVYWLHISTGFKVVGILGIILVLFIFLWEFISSAMDGEKTNKKVIVYATVLLILFLDMAIFLPTENLAIAMGVL